MQNLMNELITYRHMEKNDIPGVSDFIARVFRSAVGPLYPPEGVEEFMRYIQPDAFLKRLFSGHLTFQAEHDGKVIGAIHLRDFSHISLLFVDGEFQRRGIARELLSLAVKTCRDKSPGLRRLTVNSSPNSAPVYRRMGFQDTGIEQVNNGIRFIPMVLNLEGGAQ
ncbi:MAG TPA: GNAT family N-acetyltransferase [Desulfomonilia bacterium]|nr:GNAT family N-acetyltransferase [Desulfomonilia bacterium]